MKRLLNLGVSDPLTFGMAHPLTDRLERLTSVKVSKTKARIATGVLLLSAISISAPYTIATEHNLRAEPMRVNLAYPLASPRIESFDIAETYDFTQSASIKTFANNGSPHEVFLNTSEENTASDVQGDCGCESFVLNKYDLNYLSDMLPLDALAELESVKAAHGLSSTAMKEVKRALQDVSSAKPDVRFVESFEAPLPPIPPQEPTYIGKAMEFSNGKLISSDGPYTVIHDGQAIPMFEGHELIDSKSRILAAEAILDTVESLLDELDAIGDRDEESQAAFDEIMDAREEAREAAMEAREAAFESAVEAAVQAREEAMERKQEIKERVQEKMDRARERAAAKGI